jgi:hypothetical protein
MDFGKCAGFLFLILTVYIHGNLIFNTAKIQSPLVRGDQKQD